MPEKELVVVKFGSELVANGGVNQASIDTYARGLARIHAERDLIVVTSGAVAIGRTMLGDDAEMASCSAVGMPPLMSAWQRAFWNAGRLAGQVLVTHNELTDTADDNNMLLPATRHLLKDGVVPIFNENDMLSFKELMQLHVGGDNDGLARHIGCMLGARQLWLFTKNGGIVDENKQLISHIHPGRSSGIIDMVAARTVKSGSIGRGGMATKLAAAVEFALLDPRNVAYISQPNEDMTGERTTIISQRYDAAA